MLCIYHIADHDGKGSAAVVRSVYPETEFLGLNHDMEIPYDEIRKHDKIVVCDIALPLEFMLELSRTKDFVWIDHHASFINEYNEHLANGGAEIKGLRRIGTAACCLTWEYFYPDKELPEGLKLLGLNDIFDLRDPRVRPFEYAVQSIGVNRPGDKIWDDLLNNRINIDEMVETGKAIRIGRDCWLGGGVIVCPGVTIGDRCIIAAGSVVTRDIPDDSLAAGNPAVVKRKLDNHHDKR